MVVRLLICILTLPSIRALAQNLDSRVSLVTDDCPSELLFGDAGFSSILNVDMSRTGPGQPRHFNAARVIKLLSDVDFFISLVPWSSRSLQDVIGKSSFKATFGFGLGFDFGLWPDPNKHAADRSFDLVKKFNKDLEITDFAYPIKLPQEMMTAASQVRSAIGDNRKILVVHEETSTPEKCWDPSRMRQMLETVTSERDNLTAIVVSRRGPSFDIRGLEDRVVSIEKVSFEFFLALIAEADVFVGVDSVGLHAADLWNIPAVGLFGPTRPEEWGFRFSTSGSHIYGTGDMTNIEVDAVVNELNRVMS